MVEVQAQANVSQLLLMTNHELGKFLPLLLFLLSLVLLSLLLTWTAGSDPYIGLNAGLIFHNPIQSGRVWVRPKLRPTRPVDSPAYTNQQLNPYPNTQ